MCKFIKDILFPLNVLGKKKRSIVIDLPDGYDPVTLNINWEGDRIDVRYTRIWLPPRQYGKAQGIEQTLINGDAAAVDVIRVNNVHQRITCDKVYLECTNVEYLYVNGEKLI